MKIYYLEEDYISPKRGKCQILSLYSCYKGYVIRIFTFARKSHKRLNKLELILNNWDKFDFTVDIWGGDNHKLGKEIDITPNLVALLIFACSEVRHNFYRYGKIIDEWIINVKALYM